MKKFLILSAFVLVLPLSALAKQPNLPPGLAKHSHAPGTNVTSPDGTLWMIAANGTRRAYSSSGAFLSYGFNSYAYVVPANAGDLALPVGAFISPCNGKLIASDNGPDTGTVYLMTDGKKAAFTGAEVFTGLGFSFANVRTASLTGVPFADPITSPKQKHPKDVLINKHGTVLYMGSSGVYGIADMATFNSWGFSFSDVVNSTKADDALPQVGVLPPRQPGELSPAIQ